ncbi:TRM11 family SAM-dependent methyltransferase [Actinomadura sp. WAC 06369]|uniref:TRM11 family SAM-dependent methyltransferase n=1 Tax=Actinomadura sp. WAC 06369 TaxID=2203193 RepID=UPI001F225DEB|nr:methyltransferase domain-containing protein [Actinomadura sp. WAC 06369]
MSTEILRTGSACVESVGHREVGFRGAVGRLRTADDVFLAAARGDDVGRRKDGLGALARLARGVDLDGLVRERAALGGPRGFAGVEVSASFLGRRNFNRFDVEDAVGRVLAERAGVPYHARRDGTAPPDGYAGWRVTLDGTRASVLLRVGERPAHRRAYKVESVPGTLHPPVAAAMAQLADVRPGHRVVDPCCGAGTLLIEAAGQGASLEGFDLDAGALRAAARNAGAAPVRVRRGDAGALPVDDRSVDRVLCNPPWGVQVGARGRLADRPARLWREIARVLAPDGRAVVLVPDEGLVRAVASGLVPVFAQRLSLFGGPVTVAALELRTSGARRRS